MGYRLRLAYMTLVLVVVISVSAIAYGQEPSALSLKFPVKQNAVCGGVCTPANSPIMTVFDHQMQVAYECTTGAGGYGSVTAFTGEIGTVKYSGFKNGGGKCKGLLFAYTNPNISTFLSGYNYPGAGVLYYDGHPAIDYVFPFGTPLFPSINGCVTYLFSPEGIVDGARGNVLAIIPSPTKPAGGCQSLVNTSGYVVVYMHLASYYDATSGTVKRCTSSDPKGTECNAGQNIVACPACAQQNQWVSTSRTTPIGYTGNFASGVWGGVPAHLHYEVDNVTGKAPLAVDPYGWCGPGADPYTALTGLTNFTMWSGFTLSCPVGE
jgi:hypothetical protein